MAVHPESCLTMLAAGELAHQRWLRDSGLFTSARASAVERGAVDDTGKAIGFWQFRPAAEALLAAHWEHVLNVAEPLESCGYLNGDEAAALTGLPNPPELASEL
ncbi:hypothetical protein FKN01_27545 [Streptomyces sp. 130]|uniref:hypothetical protein n=1 Tax=Streptomyces sp. 130 TaxID=2591006 RepID=UPI00117D1EE2|nr:hypothetical protein [Streptomyces sp. 130]TRV73329.1 hypothetical protein FKN01_27545 [Streptomyces sp. 130]